MDNTTHDLREAYDLRAVSKLVVVPHVQIDFGGIGLADDCGNRVHNPGSCVAHKV